jgi:hypothetical protein
MRTVPENAGIDRVELENLVGNIEVTVGVPYKDSKNVVTRENIEVTVGVPYKLRTRRINVVTRDQERTWIRTNVVTRDHDPWICTSVRTTINTRYKAFTF